MWFKTITNTEEEAIPSRGFLAPTAVHVWRAGDPGCHCNPAGWCGDSDRRVEVETGQDGEITRAEAKASLGTGPDKPPGAEVKRTRGQPCPNCHRKQTKEESAQGWAFTWNKLNYPRKTTSTRRGRGTQTGKCVLLTPFLALPSPHPSWGGGLCGKVAREYKVIHYK